jgi:tetratricopeptide (TPR) repeat protein
MGRRGAPDDWGDDEDIYGPRSGRGGPRDSGRRGGGGGRPRLSGSQVAAALREAQQLQQMGQLDDAIQLCEELLDSGVDRPDVHYFLGWLYQEADRWEEAAGRFELLLDDPEYALSCFYALGQCARALGHLPEAAQYFDEAVDRVNLDALGLEEVDQLLQLCQEAAEAHRDMNDMEGAETIYSALLGFLRSQGWQEQVAEMERLMQETLGTAPPPPRRRRTANSRPTNIPQRSGVRQKPGGRAAAPAPPASSAHMGAVSGASAAMPVAGPVAGPMAGPMAGMPGVDPGLVSRPGALVGGGMGALVGGMPAGLGVDFAPGDQLGQLINHLNGAAGLRTSLAGLPEPLRSQVGQAVRDIENYIAHGLLTAAIEQCLRVMELAPQYLDVHLLLGEIYVRQGNIEQAVAKYAALVDTFLINGRVDDAVATFRRILQLEPNNLNYRAKLIELLSRQGRSDEVLVERVAAAESYLRLGYADRAIQEFEQALITQPSNLKIRLGYATALMKAGRAAQAVNEFQRVLQADPSNVQALTQWQVSQATGIGAGMAISVPGAPGSSRVAAMEVLGRLLRALRAEQFASYPDVAREYIQALELSPTNPDLRFALGQVHLVTGRHQEALTCFQQIAAAPGFEALGRFCAGQALLMAGDPTSAAVAVRELEQAAADVRRAPPDPAMWAARPRLDGEDQLAPELEVSSLLARAYQLSGQVAQGRAVMESVAQQRPINDEVYRAIAEINARQGSLPGQLQEYGQLVRRFQGNRQVENAVIVLKEMARLAPDDPAVRNELAEVHISRGLLDEGLSELRQLADIHVRRGQLRDAALVYQRMSEISWGQGNKVDGLNMLRQAIQYATDEMPLRQQFVQYCLESNNVPEAVEQQIVIARFYFASRQTKEAVAALQQLIAMDKQNFEAYDLLGQTYYSVGEYEQAARVYRNLTKVDPNNRIALQRLQELQAARQRG